MLFRSLSHVWIDEDGCKQGIKRLDNYRKRWSQQANRYIDEPVHDGSEGPDAFRQFAQAVDAGLIKAPKTTEQQADWKRKSAKRSWRTL